MPTECVPVQQLRVQVFRPVEDTWYTVHDLSLKWGASRKTILNWISLLRKSPWPPRPEQTRRTGPNYARRYLRIRHDYVAVMRGVFIDKTLKLRAGADRAR